MKQFSFIRPLHDNHLASVCATTLITANMALALLPSAQAILPSVVNGPRDFVLPPTSKAIADSAPQNIEKQDNTGGQLTSTNSSSSVTAEQAMPSSDNRVDDTDMPLFEDGLQWQHRLLYQELRDDDESALADVGVLWQTAIERSGTIRFAIEKLSRKNAVGDDPNDTGFAQQMVKQVARLGGVAGSMWTGTPAGLIGGGIVEDVIQTPGKQLAASQMRVTDADMVLLAKEVEALQGELIAAYYDYRHANQRLESALEAQQELARYERLLPRSVQKALATGSTKAHRHNTSEATNTAALVAPLITSVVANVNDLTRQAQQEVLSAKEALTLLVGPEAMIALEGLHKKDFSSVQASAATTTSTSSSVN
jgi:hypothetical protein